MKGDVTMPWNPEAGGAAFPLPPLVELDDPCQPPPLPWPQTSIVEELSSFLDPWEACRRLAPLPNLLFLDSAARHPTLGRYSFLTADPFHWLTSRGHQVWLDGKLTSEQEPFTRLANMLAEHRQDPMPGLPPFQGGAAGLFGYDLCHHLERLPRPPADEFEFPDLAIGFYDWVLAFDHLARRTWLLSTGLPRKDPVERRERATQRLQWVRKVLQSPASKPPILPDKPVSLAKAHPLEQWGEVVSNFSKEEYLRAASRAIEYVHAGDCFQVNLAQRLAHPLRQAPLDLYGRLRHVNPAPFAGFFDLGEFAIASASPERFLRVEEREIETRPIKGTRPRDPAPEKDLRLRQELLASSKDRAENVMIVDLLRNDLGRVCSYGSIHVPALCWLESYAHVHHLVSEIRGRLRPDLGLVDLLRAAFPGGSVTGAPKVRAMEIIAELEPTARGPYCGSLGYLGFDGAMDTNILIRTLSLGKGWAQFPVGGGIVADSDPAREYEETLHKANGLIQTLR